VVQIWSRSPQNRRERTPRTPPCGDCGWDPAASLSGQLRPSFFTSPRSGDTNPCKTTGVTLHSHVRYKENGGPQHVRAYDFVKSLRLFHTGLYPLTQSGIRLPFFNRLYFCHKSPDSGERQCSCLGPDGGPRGGAGGFRAEKRRFESALRAGGLDP
jgi:hypothetical protein